MKHMEYIDSFYKFKTPGGFKPGLDRIQAILDRVGNPEKKVKTIHVAGTNGKGSTSAMMSMILREAGYKVGFFSSPHIQSFNERMRVNGIPIADTDLARLVEVIKPVVEEIEPIEGLGGRASFFEVVTALAFMYFADQKVDALILEVGLGGRLDATNVVHPIASVITSIGLDHTEYLGDTLAAIAGEKAGIIKENVPVITGVQNEEALSVIDQIAKEKSAPLYTPLKECSWNLLENNLRYQQVDLTLDQTTYYGLKVGLLGEHQLRNATIGLRTIQVVQKYYPAVNETAIHDGLRKVKWPGRLELVQENPAVLLDGAHNIQGVEALSCFLEKAKSQYQNLYMVMSILGDKEVTAMVKQIAPLATRIIFTQNNNLRSSTAENLAEALEGENTDFELIPDFEVAIRQTVQKAKDGDLVCITGSLYTISEARELLMPNQVGVI